uniref:Uncharacterized protein n=1 Tax=Rhizophora mucronata TaxID=61149 RepID=A0A2P2QPV9_RHIMU
MNCVCHSWDCVRFREEAIWPSLQENHGSCLGCKSNEHILTMELSHDTRKSFSNKTISLQNPLQDLYARLHG